MPWSSDQFVDKLLECGDRYEIENQWFRSEVWGDRHQYVLNAWRLYSCAYRSNLGMLLLGGAKIRNDPTLLANFGFTSAGGVNKEEEKLLKKLQAKRKAVELGANTKAVGGAPDVLGTGSVLNDRNWTPLLNDAFILGGIHALHEFHFAESAAAKFFKDEMKKRNKAGAAPIPLHAQGKALWSAYFAADPETVWNSQFKVPRIFARELVGLKTFGYVPHFERDQLSFACKTPGAASHATLVQYLDAVKAAGLGECNESKVKNTIANFLFGRDWAKLPLA